MTKRKLGVSQRWGCSRNLVKAFVAATRNAFAFAARSSSSIRLIHCPSMLALAARSSSSIRPIHQLNVPASEIFTATERHTVFVPADAAF
jgi:hypothetical protein